MVAFPELSRSGAAQYHGPLLIMVKLRVGVFAHSHLSGMVVKFTLVAPHARQGTRIIELGAKAKAVKFPAKTKAAMLCAKAAELEVNAMMEDVD